MQYSYCLNSFALNVSHLNEVFIRDAVFIPTLKNFPQKKKIVQICFFHRIFFDKNVFSDNFFFKEFLLLPRPLH